MLHHIIHILEIKIPDPIELIQDKYDDRYQFAAVHEIIHWNEKWIEETNKNFKSA